MPHLGRRGTRARHTSAVPARAAQVPQRGTFRRDRPRCRRGLSPRGAAVRMMLVGSAPPAWPCTGTREHRASSGLRRDRAVSAETTYPSVRPPEALAMVAGASIAAANDMTQEAREDVASLLPSRRRGTGSASAARTACGRVDWVLAHSVPRSCATDNEAVGEQRSRCPAVALLLPRLASLSVLFRLVSSRSRAPPSCQNQQRTRPSCGVFSIDDGCAPDTIRTYDLGFRKALLYPTELRGRRRGH